EREHHIADVRGAPDAPVLQHELRPHPVPLQGEITAGFRQLTARDVAAFWQPRLAILEPPEREQICVLLEARFPRADAIHDTVAKRQLRHSTPSCCEPRYRTAVTARCRSVL